MDKTIKFKRNEEKFLSSDLGDETVIMNLETGDYIGLNDVGSDIWNLLKSPKSINDLVPELLKIYEILEEECLTDLVVYMEQLLEKELILPS